MANARGKTIDTTSLDLIAHSKISRDIHRDYLTHCLRYTHIARVMAEGKRHQTAHLLDVGCGSEAPLARLLRSMMMTPTTGSYTGVDYSKVPWPWPNTTAEKARATFHDQVDFVTVELERKDYDVITSFEVLEHVEPLHSFHMLKRMRGLCHDGTLVYISTPVFSPRVGAAKNHVNEMSEAGLRALIYAAGFQVDDRWGTFANQRDYKDHLSAAEREVWETLKTYYDSAVLACFMAPLHPECSRNIIWKLCPGRPDATRLEGVKDASHSSSDRWVGDLKAIKKEVGR